MARYRGEVHGRSKTPASRLGSRVSGLTTNTNGWDVGADVFVRPDPGNPDHDQLSVTVHGGSNGRTVYREVVICRETDDGVEVVLLHPDTRRVVARHVLEY